MTPLPLRKLRVSDEEWNAWKAVAPDGNVSGCLRSLANAALNDSPSGDSGRPSGGELPRVHDPEYVRREAALLATLSQEA
jgi:hypothetical protein